MAVKIIKNLKCPKCSSTQINRIAENFFHCNQCGNRYYGSTEVDGLLVSSTLPKKSTNLLLILVTGFVIFGGVFLLIQKFTMSTGHNYLTDNANQLTEGSQAPRTAYVIYQDLDEQNSVLLRADFMTQNHSDSDQNILRVEKIGGELFGYDKSSGKIIANLSLLSLRPLSIDAAILYVDTDNIIVKNKVKSGYQLEMIDLFSGDVLWTLAEEEVPGIKNLTGLYSDESHSGIKLLNDNFRLTLPPSYYVFDKKGNIIDFGKQN
ncbi:hypothetical protein DES39_0769 [Orbus hercynius]|uniref:Uncharacterized protein n=1 Tax=Orbus hercynius TaxID=593135 RepID=A0A495RJ23_9GAMM|nr:hypothetical protein [Orbus hercynius]RKS87533.1 hypothetical protein DES39_0769 [Orbus hercynius]